MVKVNSDNNMHNPILQENTMKKYLLCLVLLIFSLYLMAEGADNNTTANYTTEQMDALAAQYKASTGFEGLIGYDLNKGSFSGLSGRYTSLVATDTLSAKNTAKALLSILQPYMKVNLAQLTDWSVDRDNVYKSNYLVIVSQRINGLEIESHPQVTFLISKKHPGVVSIANQSCIDIDLPLIEYMSRERAEEILRALPGMGDITIRSKSELLVCPIDKDNSEPPSIYRPCWRISVWHSNYEHFLYYVDAETGALLKKGNQILTINQLIGAV